ncbi:hypothetical protein H6F74_03590 [Trichocoleus sp. FACHB-90]|uniref:hypothetical protein n=1 Tax=Cyanophyceae TaxID=3028117 RepID=UPI001688E110|nr:hypothetical protein [Trichocoleus sp. FACHB-90]MBD1925372.1 hypothetical protein [Trichocoleus sp. FACHB-90]
MQLGCNAHGDAPLLDLARGSPDLVQSGVAGRFVATLIIQPTQHTMNAIPILAMRFILPHQRKLR